MQRIFVAIVASALVFIGTGCTQYQKPAEVLSPTLPPAGYIPTPIVTSTQTLPNGWTTFTVGGVWSFSHPGVVQTENETPPVETRARQTTIDLGTAVEGGDEKSVPRRTLVVDQLLRGDDYLTIGCVATSTRLGSPSSVISTTTAQGIGICLRTQEEGAAGNRYHTISATILGIGSAYAMSYTVHSVECANYENPADACVAFDTDRDTALFSQILHTLRPNR